jgi:alpha-soluble NSF attachment protein
MIRCYEKIGFKYLTQTVKSSAKDFFFKAGLCYLANADLVGAKRALDKYSLEDPSWDTSRQAKFLNSLWAACEAKDNNMFTKIV